MRKAFTLIELLVVVATLPFVMLAISGVFVTIIRDVPRTTRLLQHNTTVLNMTQQLRRDMDEATGLPEEHDGRQAGQDTLLIETSGRIVCYEVKPKRIVRTMLDETGPGSGQERLWRIGDAVVAWHLWRDANKAYAVEVRSHQQQRVGTQLREKLAGTHVLFVGGLGKDHAIK